MSLKFGKTRPGSSSRRNNPLLSRPVEMGAKEKAVVARVSVGRNKTRRNKSTKTSIEFNPEKRRQFLTGFRKRKEERRRKAREKIHKDAKEEVKKARYCLIEFIWSHIM